MENSDEPCVPTPLPEDFEAKLPGKRRGEIAELAFMRKAITLGFGVAKPWGDSDRYDFILNSGHTFWRVQVKSVWTQPRCSSNSGARFYVRVTGHQGTPYTPEEIDFLVAYIISKNLWYVIPVAELGSTRVVGVRPFSPRSRFEQFRENWDLLRQAPPATERSTV